MKRWDLSNRKMADLLNVKSSNVDTLRRSVTQPSVTIILKLESLTGIPAKSLFESNIPYANFPAQPILTEDFALEPDGQPYVGQLTLSELPMKQFFQHVEELTIKVADLKKEFEAFKATNSK